MPASRVRTRCHSGPGRSGGSTLVYSSGPMRTAADGASADATRASPSRDTDRRTCSAFMLGLAALGLASRPTAGPTSSRRPWA